MRNMKLDGSKQQKTGAKFHSGGRKESVLCVTWNIAVT